MLEHSRSLRLAATAAGRSESTLEAVLESSRVVVSVEPDMPMALLTTRVLLTTLRRGPGVLVLERGALAARDAEGLEEVVAAIDPVRPLEVVTAAADPTVRLHVGASNDHAIRLVPEGFGAHIAGQRTAVVRPTRPGNPIGAVYTAALGAAEAFKHTARVLPKRRVLHRHLQFCPLTLTGDLSLAPDLPDELVFELALIGVGAIGTAVVLILDTLGASGRLLAVDPQRLARENRGTYSLGTDADVRANPWKVDLAREMLPRFDVVPVHERVEDLPQAIDSGAIPWFRTVMTALDSAEARRAAQRIWPDRLIDAGTGDTVLGINDYEHGGRCMFCVFPIDRGGPSAAELISQETGLSVDRAMRGDEPIADADLDELTPDQNARLRPYLGRPVCGLMQALGLTGLEANGYQPSTPFISLQAACLATSRLVARAVTSPVEGNLVQYDGLVGPQRLLLDQMQPVPGCTCQTRAGSIEEVRTRRGASTPRRTKA